MVRIISRTLNCISENRMLSIFLVMICLILWASTVKAENPTVTIEEAVWSNSVDENKNPMQKYNDSITGISRLFLWTRIHGKEDALNYLKRRGKLPISHQWFIYVGTDPSYEDALDLIDAIKLNVGNKEVLDKLAWQMKTKGYFEWRTWSMKRNIRPGWWKVKIVYADGESVYCDDKPCEYVIKVE